MVFVMVNIVLLLMFNHTVIDGYNYILIRKKNFS